MPGALEEVRQHTSEALEKLMLLSKETAPGMDPSFMALETFLVAAKETLEEQRLCLEFLLAVSYTHLTLPTIYSV